jgi:hypothetical protein
MSTNRRRGDESPRCSTYLVPLKIPKAESFTS